MAITVPVAGAIIDATTFGAPVANQLNAQATEAWTNLALTGGWTSVSGYQVAQYRKNGTNTEIRGLILANPTSQSGQQTQICTLPAGYRPPTTLQWIIAYTSAGSRINIGLNIRSDGVMLCLDSFSNMTSMPITFSFGNTTT